jgi:hypothetical protein
MNVRVVLVPLLAVGAALLLWQQADEPAGHGGVPAATWRIGTGTDVRQGKNYDTVPAESPIRLAWSCDEPRWVYVVSHSDVDGTLLLFPAPELRGSPANPLPAGKVVLPGSRDGKEIAWTSRRDVLPTTTYVVVACRERHEELESLLPRLRRWTNSALPDGSMQVTNPTAPFEGELAGRPRTPLPHPLLQRAADRSLTETVVNGPLASDTIAPDTWIGSWRITEQRPTEAPTDAPAEKR